MTKTKKPTPKPIYIRPSEALRAALDRRVRQERRTLTAVVEAAIVAYLKTEVAP